MLALATLSPSSSATSARRRARRRFRDPRSPWGECDGWRLNQDNHHIFVFREGEHQVAVTAHYRKGTYEVELPGGRRMLSGGETGAHGLRAWIDGEVVEGTVVHSGATIDVFHGAERHSLELTIPGSPRSRATRTAAGSRRRCPAK